MAAIAVTPEIRPNPPSAGESDQPGSAVVALSELSAAIPERLPASLNFADLGSKFEAILEKKSIHLQPASANLFSATGARIIRFNLVSQDYLLPETFRLQALLTVTGNRFRPNGPMSLMFHV